MDSKPTATNPATGDKSARGQSPLNLAGLRQAGELAALAYEPFLHTAMALARVPRFEVVTVGHLDLRAVIIFRPERTDILVRGTVDMENWIIDLDVRKERLADFPGVKVHAGFLKAELALLPLILEEMPMHIRRSMRPPINLYGHSLGGALAAKIAFSLFHLGYPIQDVVTFASPRVGNAAWRNAYNAVLGDNTVRVVAQGDLVPLLPGVLDGYRHVGREVYLTGKIWLNPSRLTEIALDSFRVMRALARGDVEFLLKFHSMRMDYLRLLPAKSCPDGVMGGKP